MLTKIKLVQNTHCSLQCQYRTSLVFRRKKKANRNQTSAKIHTGPYNAGIQNQSGIQKKTNANRNQTSAKIHTGPQNAGIEPVWYSEKKQMRTGIKLVHKYTMVLTMLVQNHFGIQKKTNANRNQTGAKIHTGHYNMLLQNQSRIVKKTKCQQQSNWC